MKRELFKEQWPYFRRDPIRWIQRWWMLRKGFKETRLKLDNFSKLVGIHRLPGETDAQLRARMKEIVAKPPSKFERVKKVFTDYGHERWEIVEGEHGEFTVKTETRPHWLFREELEKTLSEHIMGFRLPVKVTYEKFTKENT